MATVDDVNFHHLRYFWAVAKDGNLTRTARRLRVAQSALSAQIRQLEEHLGQALFAREGRQLVLNEAGKVALAYAEDIFAAGDELVSTLKGGRRRQHTLRMGAVATLSRNFQRSFVQPLLTQANVRLGLSSGSFEELLTQLETHAIDVVLSNKPASRSSERRFRSRQLARQPVSIVSSKALVGFRFPEDLREQWMVLPGAASDLRTEFDSLCERLGVRVRVRAEVDDMAMMRLLARDGDALTLVPSIVVREELRRGLVHELCVVPDLSETFYAITIDRRFQHPLLRPLLDREESELLSPVPERADASDLQEKASHRPRRAGAAAATPSTGVGGGGAAPGRQATSKSARQGRRATRSPG